MRLTVEHYVVGVVGFTIACVLAWLLHVTPIDGVREQLDACEALGCDCRWVDVGR